MGDDANFAASVTSALAGKLGTGAIGSTVQGYNAMLSLLAALGDPGADRIPFWDESANALVWRCKSTATCQSPAPRSMPAAAPATIRPACCSATAATAT